MLPPWVALAVRPRPGVWEYIRVNVHALVLEELEVTEFLHFKEELVDGRYKNYYYHYHASKCGYMPKSICNIVFVSSYIVRVIVISK